MLKYEEKSNPIRKDKESLFKKKCHHIITLQGINNAIKDINQKISSGQFDQIKINSEIEKIETFVKNLEKPISLEVEYLPPSDLKLEEEIKEKLKKVKPKLLRNCSKEIKYLSYFKINFLKNRTDLSSEWIAKNLDKVIKLSDNQARFLENRKDLDGKWIAKNFDKILKLSDKQAEYLENIKKDKLTKNFFDKILKLLDDQASVLCMYSKASIDEVLKLDKKDVSALKTTRDEYISNISPKIKGNRIQKIINIIIKIEDQNSKFSLKKSFKNDKGKSINIDPKKQELEKTYGKITKVKKDKSGYTRIKNSQNAEMHLIEIKNSGESTTETFKRLKTLDKGELISDDLLYYEKRKTENIPEYIIKKLSGKNKLIKKHLTISNQLIEIIKSDKNCKLDKGNSRVLVNGSNHTNFNGAIKDWHADTGVPEINNITSGEEQTLTVIAYINKDDSFEMPTYLKLDPKGDKLYYAGGANNVITIIPGQYGHCRGNKVVKDYDKFKKSNPGVLSKVSERLGLKLTPECNKSINNFFSTNYDEAKKFTASKNEDFNKLIKTIINSSDKELDDILGEFNSRDCPRIAVVTQIHFKYKGDPKSLPEFNKGLHNKVSNVVLNLGK